MRRNLFWLNDEQWKRIEPHLSTDVRARHYVALRRAAQSRRSRKILLLSLVLLRNSYITRYLCERPAYGLAPERVLFTRIMIMKTLFHKFTRTATDPHTIRLAAIAQLDRDLDAAIDAALSAGVAVHTVVETLERKENAALSHGRIASVLMCLGGAFRSCLASG